MVPSSLIYLPLTLDDSHLNLWGFWEPEAIICECPEDCWLV